MIDWLSAAILGLVQGLTEFLPVSSSGHLVVFQQFLSDAQTPVIFDLFLHLGTLLPIVAIYRKDLWELIQTLFQNPFGSEARLGWWIVLGSVPTALIGIFLEELFESIFHTPKMVGIAFLITGTFLFATKYLKESHRDITEMSWKDAILIGVVQGFAITPGISRSGSTISMALLLGLKRDFAAKYSFLLSIPAIVGGFVLKLDELQTTTVSSTSLAVGFTVAAISGWVALKILLNLVNTGDFSKFSYYLWVIAILAIGFM